MTKAKSAKPILRAPRNGLGHGNTNAKAVMVDEFDWEAFEIIYPPLTLDAIKQYDYKHEVIAAETTQADFDALDEEERERYFEAFRDTDGFSEMEDAFRPIMLYFWPLFMHGRDPVKVAELIDEFAPAVSLVELSDRRDLKNAVGEDYALCLSGGGMNLSDHLALAYICAGAIPPLELLTGLSGVMSEDRLARCKGALDAAYKAAKASLKNDIDRLTRERKTLFAKAKVKAA